MENWYVLDWARALPMGETAEDRYGPNSVLLRYSTVTGSMDRAEDQRVIHSGPYRHSKAEAEASRLNEEWESSLMNGSPVPAELEQAEGAAQ